RLRKKSHHRLARILPPKIRECRNERYRRDSKCSLAGTFSASQSRRTTAFTCRAGCKERDVSENRNADSVKCNALFGGVAISQLVYEPLQPYLSPLDPHRSQPFLAMPLLAWLGVAT